MRSAGRNCNKIQDTIRRRRANVEGHEAMWILGCGYIGQKLARRYLDLGQPIVALTRSQASRQALVEAGIPALARDLTCDPLDDLDWAGKDLFHLAPPSSAGVEDGATRRLVASFRRAGHPRRLIYMSTTGIYGDCGGVWVDETRPPAPAADRSLRRWDAEETLRAWSHEAGAELVILRVAGIYGPGRLPLERIRQGLPLVREEESPWSNRIHADDLVEACIAAMALGRPGAVYNVCDDHPSTMTDYFLRVAAAAGLPPPPLLSLKEATGVLSAGILSYLAESRRLSNQRLREELGLKLRYPDLATGLPTCL
jgi:nucleoside-diphosphate-sugar epimerase